MKIDEFKRLALSEWRGMKPGLTRMIAACERLGRPENKFPSIHIAGTNGKGSVAAMLHSILSAAGYRAGLFTSPHLVRVNERFRVGEEEISDGELKGILEMVSAKEGGDLSFFELCTLIAFLYFAEKKVDIAVVEVGLGGRLDATNVITPLVSVITEIALDHTEILGSDIAAIAREKAGIIKPVIPVVCGATADEAKEVIRAVAKEKGAPLISLLPFNDLPLALSGLHQRRNAAIALTAVQVLEKMKVDEKAIREGFQNVCWPGRMEWISRDPPILLDGAHNPAGMRALVDSLKKGTPLLCKEGWGEVEGSNLQGGSTLYPSLTLPLQRGGDNGFPKKWKVLFSAASDKAVGEMLQILSEIATEITVCRMENARSIDPSNVGATHASPLHIGGNAFETYQKMVKELKEDEGLLVTGSLYLVGEIKKGIITPPGPLLS